MSTEPSEPSSSPSLSTITADRSRWPLLVAGVGIGIVGAGCWLASGPLGLLAAAVVALCWYRLSSLYAVAIGHAVLLVMTAGTLTPALLIAEIGLGLLLIAPVVDTTTSMAFIGAFLAGLSGLLAVSGIAYWWNSQLWITAAVLVGTLAVAGYGLHRYELVHLGIIESDLT